MQKGRVEKIKESTEALKGEYVLYWMHASQRIKNNHALEVAIQLANRYEVPLLVGFAYMPDFPSAEPAHFDFMFEGMMAVEKALGQMDIGFVCMTHDPVREMLACSEKALAVVLDKGHTTYSVRLREAFVGQIDKDLYLVDSNVIVPVHVAYPKEAYAAYAIRSALMKKLPLYGVGFELSKVKKTYTGANQPLIERSLTAGACFKGGESEALNRLETFVAEKLAHYATCANAPERQCVSQLSPYLHFGQISPITIYEAVTQSGVLSAEFIEQLFVRRELAYNFVYYNPHYQDGLDQILPTWALDTLKTHAADQRHRVYALSELEDARTHDPYWNAAQNQMRQTGHMHNHMRMYWGKKIIEWTKTHEEAFSRLLYLNDKYQLDGRDPNGYAGIAWCFGKHDRPFMERAIFGKVRYMAASGLEKKFDMSQYVKRYGE